MFPFELLYEDNHLLIVNKQVGIPSQADLSGEKDLISYAKEYIKDKYHKPGKVFCGLVHRLDRPTSGLIILAKTSKALSRMQKMFQDRMIEKHYLAVSHLCPPQNTGILRQYIYKDHKKNKAYVTTKSGRSKYCELNYRVFHAEHGYFYLHVIPMTGRSHQIRVQMASQNAPLYGDRKYGGLLLDKGSYGLHAAAVKFEHPVKKSLLCIEAAIPDTEPWVKLRKANVKINFDKF